MQPLAPYQRRIILGLLIIIFAGLMMKVVDRHRRAVGFDVAGFLDGYRYTTVIDSTKPEVNVSTNAVNLTDNKTGEISAAGKTISVDINKADIVTLQELPGVGPVLAQRIINFRDSIGRFKQPKDLLEVPGIGEKKLAKMKEYLKF
jgi:competence ComEA-like helix-hairpin-helix protein